MRQMKKSELLNIISDADLNEDQVRFQYTGQNMMSQECVALVGTISDFGKFLIAMSWQDGEDLFSMELAQTVSVDDSGSDTIFYWTNLIAVG